MKEGCPQPPRGTRSGISTASRRKQPCLDFRPQDSVLTSGLLFFLLLNCQVVSDSLLPHGPQHVRLLCPWDSPGMNWSGLPFPSTGNLPDPGIQPASPGSPALVSRFFTAETQGTPHLPSLPFTNYAVKPPLTFYKDTCDYI